MFLLNYRVKVKQQYLRRLITRTRSQMPYNYLSLDGSDWERMGATKFIG